MRPVALILLFAGCASPPAPVGEEPQKHLGVIVESAELADTGGRSDDDRNQAKSLVGEAAAKRNAGDLHAAERAAEQALELDASLPEAHVEWALAAEGLARDPSLIAAHYQLAARLSPDNGRAQLLAGQWSARIGDVDRAYDLYSRAIAADPQLAEAYARRADVLVGRGDHRAAVADFQRARDLDPKFVPALTGLADSAEASQQFDVAERAHKELIALYPSVTLYRSRIIAFYKRTGNTAAAAVQQRALDKLAPKDTRRLRSLKKKK